MSTHPNVILMAELTPDDLARKTMRNIVSESEKSEFFDEDTPKIKIGGIEYYALIMESDWNEGAQISSKEGNLIFYDMITYGYGKKVEFSKLEIMKNDLEKWAEDTCKKFNCNYKIFITANYW